MSSILQCLGPYAQRKRIIDDPKKMTKHCWPPTKIEVDLPNELNDHYLMCTQPSRRDRGH